MSMASEWTFAVHRAIWFPALHAMGLERDAIEAPIRGAYVSRVTEFGYALSSKEDSPSDPASHRERCETQGANSSRSAVFSPLR